MEIKVESYGVAALLVAESLIRKMQEKGDLTNDEALEIWHDAARRAGGIGMGDEARELSAGAEMLLRAGARNSVAAPQK